MSWIKKNLADTNNPRQFGLGLVGDRSEEWRYRIGAYRLIADTSNEIVTILLLEIGHRREIYQ